MKVETRRLSAVVPEVAPGEGGAAGASVSVTFEVKKSRRVHARGIDNVLFPERFFP